MRPTTTGTKPIASTAASPVTVSPSGTTGQANRPQPSAMNMSAPAKMRRIGNSCPTTGPAMPKGG